MLTTIQSLKGKILICQLYDCVMYLTPPQCVLNHNHMDNGSFSLDKQYNFTFKIHR